MHRAGRARPVRASAAFKLTIVPRASFTDPVSDSNPLDGSETRPDASPQTAGSAGELKTYFTGAGARWMVRASAMLE